MLRYDSGAINGSHWGRRWHPVSTLIGICFLHLSVAEAAPISLFAIALSAGIGALLGFKNKILRYRAVGFTAIFGLLLSPLGLWVAQRVPTAPLLMLFSCTLFFISSTMLLQSRREKLHLPKRKRKPPPCLLNPEVGKLSWNIPCARSLLIAGSWAGFLSGLLAVKAVAL
ncbi:sulfite exporter TauE/SafE family protein [Polynucleobacter necessarius]|uniref:sulfite exporter TauE/SafE family protein n=1 Tax=Polynucleobacter necessarius TaxID=576610 RepID=UPI001E5642CE|nr:sulfite exporter TauE/SafE family protein [Polynucleobacter necessarius]